jgi:hypothetical protein
MQKPIYPPRQVRVIHDKPKSGGMLDVLMQWRMACDKGDKQESERLKGILSLIKAHK